MDEETKENPLENLGKFAKMAKKQLKKAYNIDVKRVLKKMDLHDQPKAVLKIGSGDDRCELWFREGDDESIVIDKIKDKKAVGTLTIKKPVCHLRTAALLSSKMGLPEKKEEVEEKKEIPSEWNNQREWPLKEGVVKQVAHEIIEKLAEMTGEDWEHLWDHFMGDPESFVSEYADRLDETDREKLKTITQIKEDVERKEEEEIKEPEEPEDFEEEFTAPTNKFAIVDASVLEGVDNDLIDDAIFVPQKHPGAIFSVVANYDDTILRNLTIAPAEVEENGIDVVKTTKTEGIAPLSHDSSPERAVRKTIKQIHHMSDKNSVPLRIKEPGKKVDVKRDQSQKDQRRKQREAKRDAVKEEISNKLLQIKTLLSGDDTVLSEMNLADLEFAKKVLIKLGHDDMSALDHHIGVQRERETHNIMEYVQWVRRGRMEMISQLKS